jgi:starch phosphorylase
MSNRESAMKSTAATNPIERLPSGDLRDAIRWHITHTLATTPHRLTPPALLRALCLAIRDRSVERMLESERRYEEAGAKRLYYLSMEFLIGRSLNKNLINLRLIDECRSIVREFGSSLESVSETEIDAALGNGGLGRLAACFLDSLATLEMPGYGYGINYEFGMFRQEIRGGEQVELPDNWRTYPSPWMIERPTEAILIPFHGHVEHTRDRDGNYNPMWLDWNVVIGVPHDMPIVGYGGRTVNYLRLYSARASREVDMTIFNEGDYIKAVNQKVTSETISKILYPSDSILAGRELRLMQEYFLVTCAVRDMVDRYEKLEQKTRRAGSGSALYDNFPDRVAVQLNDTHPTLAIVELMRVLIDEKDVPWEKAWEIIEATFGYTNHTLMPEALERWPVPLFEQILPRHLEIIYEINQRFLDRVKGRWPGDAARVTRMSLIEEGPVKQVRMANLAIAGSHSVNGVAEVHSRLVATELVPDFYQLWPQKFNNKTNGVTPRRWLLGCNPELSSLITGKIGTEWITDLDRLRDLLPLAEDPDFQNKFQTVKRHNKQHLAAQIRDDTGLSVDPESLFDVQVKRIHEYKRQLLNVLHIVHEYLQLADDGKQPSPPRTFLFAGKAAPGYHAAKRIIRLINDVARVVNGDPRVGGSMRVVFMPDYRVTLAERIIPAADLSEQISTAGTEASGTSNMKFAMNGALTIGTLDGANIEIREEVGAENVFIFGLTVDQVREIHSKRSYQPMEIYRQSESVRRIVNSFKDGRFSTHSHDQHAWVWQKLLDPNEPYLHLADLDFYLQAHSQAARLYLDQPTWTAKAIRTVAKVGKFSSDRTIREYARDIWGIQSIK